MCMLFLWCLHFSWTLVSCKDLKLQNFICLTTDQRRQTHIAGGYVCSRILLRMAQLILTCIVYIFYIYICTVHISWKYWHRCLNSKYNIYIYIRITCIYIYIFIFLDIYIYIYICVCVCVCLVHSQFETEMQNKMNVPAGPLPDFGGVGQEKSMSRFNSLGQRDFAGLCQENPKRSCPTFRHEITNFPWTSKPWRMKVLHPQYMGYNP